MGNIIMATQTRVTVPNTMMHVNDIHIELLARIFQFVDSWTQLMVLPAVCRRWKEGCQLTRDVGFSAQSFGRGVFLHLMMNPVGDLLCPLPFASFCPLFPLYNLSVKQSCDLWGVGSI